MIRNLREIAAGVTPKPQDASKEEVIGEIREGLEGAGLIEGGGSTSKTLALPASFQVERYAPASFEEEERRRQLHEDMFGAPWERCGGDPPDDDRR